MRITAFCVIAILAMVACTSRKEIPVAQIQAVTAIDSAMDSVAVVSPDTAVFYQRTACFGMCPIYQCVILSNGLATYEGRNFVERIGFFQTTLDATALHRIQNVANEIDYFSMKSVYDHAYVTDLPSVITQIAKDGKVHGVMNRYDAPQSLGKLYGVLDSLIASAKWTAIAPNKNE
jgi:hypothetical protein